MKDKLMELAGEMRNELCSDFAQKLEAILDAEAMAGAGFGEADGVALRSVKVGETLTESQWSGICQFVRHQDSIIRGLREALRNPVPDIDAHPARSGVVRDATPEMCDSVRYLLVGMERAGRTFGSVRDHCRMSGMDVENWPHWTINRETEHFNKSACAALIWWLMHRAAIQGERHER
jgi:hypothetical protein